MNFRNYNGIRDIQVMLKEAGLYTAGIDGAWETGSDRAANRLVTNYYLGVANAPLPNIPASSVPGDAQTQVIVKTQDLLKTAGLYTDKVDGIYGNGTKGGFRKATDTYITQARVPRFGHAWSKAVKPEFMKAVVAGCVARNWPAEAPDWLMSCMYFESAGTYSPSIQNKAGAKYFGLIQFGDAAATDLKTTVAELVKLSQLEQLEWVFKYFDLWVKRGKKITQLEDFYLAIFYPAVIGKKADEKLFDKDSTNRLEAKSYLQNNGFDRNKDGTITVGEICSTIYDIYYKGMDTANRVQIV